MTARDGVLVGEERGGKDVPPYPMTVKATTVMRALPTGMDMMDTLRLEECGRRWKVVWRGE